jgi:hypothetical protein
MQLHTDGQLLSSSVFFCQHATPIVYQYLLAPPPHGELADAWAVAANENWSDGQTDGAACRSGHMP